MNCRISFFMVLSACVTLFIMMFFPTAVEGNPYSDEDAFFTDHGLEIVEDFEAYELQEDPYPYSLPLSSREIFAEGEVVEFISNSLYYSYLPIERPLSF